MGNDVHSSKIVRKENSLKPREAILRMEPYRPPSSGRGGKMRLDFNENTQGCSPLVLRGLKQLKADALAVYPEYEEARPRLARYFQVSPEQMTLTNGTDEAIQLVVNAYVNAGDRVVVLRPSYAMYRFYAQVAGARIGEVDYPPDLSFPEKQLLHAVRARTKAIFIANPNNPTGTAATLEQLKTLLQAAPQAAVLVDEAYFEFCGRTVLTWIGEYPNLFVSRTFSKAFGLAALRLGCLFSQEQNIAAIRKGQSPYSVNAMAVAAALEATRNPGYVKKYVAEVLRARRMLCEELDRLGLKYFPSEANFVLVRFGESARKMRERLGEHEILVRDRSYELPGCVRITVGTVPQTRKLIRVLRRCWLASRPARAPRTAPL
ncbi:MAG: histidinol-phosphate transaminase [Acidobacteria bacterium]|nr:histidinol-phosphate transaminase [Acidobacteriota bacterium]